MSANLSLFLKHYNCANRAGLRAVPACDALGLVNFRQPVFVVRDCCAVAGANAGAAALAVFLINSHTLGGNIRGIIVGMLPSK